MGTLGIFEWTLIVLIILLFFGAKRIPGIARTIGHSIKEFRNGRSEPGDAEDKEEIE